MDTRRYVVRTQWGSFSLDEGAYQDYLEGKLWISWIPGKTMKPIANGTFDDEIPIGITPKAAELRASASAVGSVYAVLQEMFPRRRVSAPYRSTMAAVSIDEMSLTVRAYNGLKRAGVNTLGDLFALTEQEGGISRIRNIGTKSVMEIERAFLEETYRRLSPAKQGTFWQSLL